MEYAAGTLSSEELSAAFKEVFEQSGGWQTVQERLGDEEHLVVEEDVPLAISTGEAGLDPATATIIVATIGAVAPLVHRVLTDLWTEKWLPTIKARKGDDALGDKVS